MAMAMSSTRHYIISQAAQFEQTPDPSVLTIDAEHALPMNDLMSQEYWSNVIGQYTDSEGQGHGTCGKALYIGR